MEVSELEKNFFIKVSAVFHIVFSDFLDLVNLNIYTFSVMASIFLVLVLENPVLKQVVSSSVIVVSTV